MQTLILSDSYSSPSNVLVSNNLISTCFLAVFLFSGSNSVILDSQCNDCIPNENYAYGDIVHGENNDYSAILIPEEEVQVEEVMSEFINKLVSNMKTPPFEFYENVSKRPWDFV